MGRGALLLLLAGCDKLFLDPPDAAVVDAPVVCWNDVATGNDDGDAFVDGCDLCPADPDVAPIPDGDGDGVSNTCDPTTSSDTVAYFDTFATLAGWTPTNGKWGLDSDRARQEIITPAGAETTLQRPLTAVRASLDTLLITPELRDTATAGVYVRVGPGTRVSCTFHKVQTSGSDFLRLAIDGVEVARTTDPITIFGTTLRLRLIQDADGTFHCRGRFPQGTEHAVMARTLPVATTTEIGLLTMNSQAAFDFITVFAGR